MKAKALRDAKTGEPIDLPEDNELTRCPITGVYRTGNEWRRMGREAAEHLLKVLAAEKISGS